MKEIILQAKKENLAELYVFLDKELGFLDDTAKAELHLIAEEIFVNIASYAYGDSVGSVMVRLETDREKQEVFMSFQDEGVAYNPLEKEDPDITPGIEEREIGGLGIYMAKRMADRIAYQYQFPYNILYIWKKVAESSQEVKQDEE